MILLRKTVYALMESRYLFGPILSGWLYEYRKDLLTYVLIAAVIHLLQYYRMRMEANSRASANETNSATKRLAARRLNREFVLNTDDISHIESDGNYVKIHAHGAVYRLRASLAGIERRLGGECFVRVHRSHLVNVDHIAEIQPWYHGDYRILLTDESMVNFSQRYRARLDRLLDSRRQRQAGEAA